MKAVSISLLRGKQYCSKVYVQHRMLCIQEIQYKHLMIFMPKRKGLTAGNSTNLHLGSRIPILINVIQQTKLEVFLIAQDIRKANQFE